MTFDAGARPHPRALREAVRRVEFTPTHVRYWVEGTVEAGPSHSTLTLVSQATGQRFTLEPLPGVSDRAVFSAMADLRGRVTLWGLVETSAGGTDIILRVEGHETVRP